MLEIESPKISFLIHIIATIFYSFVSLLPGFSFWWVNSELILVLSNLRYWIFSRKFDCAFRKAYYCIIVWHKPGFVTLRLVDGGAQSRAKTNRQLSVHRGPFWRSASLLLPGWFGFYPGLVVGVVLVSLYICRRTSDLCKQLVFIGQHVYIGAPSRIVPKAHDLMGDIEVALWIIVMILRFRTESYRLLREQKCSFFRDFLLE